MKSATAIAAISVLLLSGCREDKPKQHADTAREKTAAINEAAVMAGQIIVPGRRIGAIAIGDDMEQVIKVLGPPAGSDAAMGKTLSYWYAPPAGDEGLRYRTAVFSSKTMGSKDGKRRVRQVVVTSPAFRTADHIHKGSALGEIRKIFKNLRKVAVYPEGGRKIQVYDAVAEGITFDIDEHGHCVAITVHEPGTAYTNTYLELHPGISFMDDD